MRIGLLHARSGAAGIWSPAMDAAAIVAAAEINAADGVLNEAIDLSFADCGTTVGEALQAIDALVDVEGADVIIGGHPSNVRDAVSQRLAGKVPYIYTPQYEGTACGPSTVAIGSTDQELMAPALQWLRDNKRAERFFFVGNDYVWPHMALATARRLLGQQGGTLVGHAFLPGWDGNNEGVMKQIARSGAQVVIQALVGQAAVEFNRAFAAAGLDEKLLRFGLIVDETVMCGIGAEASTNLFTAAHYFAANASHANDGFLERYHGAFGEWAPPVSAASVSYYEGLHVFAGLARQVGSRRGEDLARHLDRSLPRATVRHGLSREPAGSTPRVYLGQADGVTLKVVATFGG